MILPGTIVYAKRPSVASMNLWKRVNQNVDSVLCPCKLHVDQKLVVEDAWANGALFCRLFGSDPAVMTVVLDYDVSIP